MPTTMPTTPTDRLQKYPSLDEPSHADKISHNSDNSDDSGVVDWKDPKIAADNNRVKLESQMSCDVMFLVGDKQEEIGAHKANLMEKSAVFRHKLKGAEGSNSKINLPDIAGDCFWEVLRHIYCNDERLQVLNVVGILYAANQFDLIHLRQACLDFLHNCIEINNACYLLAQVHEYGYPEEEKVIKTFIRKNAYDVFQTKGMDLLPRDLLNEVLTLPEIDVDESAKKQVLDRWARSHCEEKKQNITEEALMDSLQDCLYVYRDDSSSHRFIMDSVTSRNIFDDKDEPVDPSSPSDPTSPKLDEMDGMSTISSATSRTARSSVHTYSRLPSCHKWADVDQVTRLQEIFKSDTNDATQADAISFTADQNLYLYGFSIYGSKNDGEAKYTVDTIVYRKKKEIVMESIAIKGAGVILPVMFERPIKIDKGYLYTLEIYIKGPLSHMGTSGQTKVQNGSVLFTFSNAAKVKKNRTDMRKGQIPRLYYLVRNK